MQLQPGTGSRNGTSLPRAQKKPRSTLAHSDGKPRVQLSSQATRAQSGLCRPIWVSLRACKLHLPCAMHTGCARPAGSSRLASGKPPPMARACVLPQHSGDLIEITAPNCFRLQLVADAPSASCISADPRAPGRPWATAVAPSRHGHIAWLFEVSHRCADRAWAGPRLVQLAAWKLTAVAQPLAGSG